MKIKYRIAYFGVSLLYIFLAVGFEPHMLYFAIAAIYTALSLI